ncbi:MAG: SHOCT domain-containing protein [Acidimicrobiales bacterium]
MILANIGLGELIWSLFVAFLMISYLMALFSVLLDVFRDRELSGGAKALWVLALLVLPLLTLLVYLVARGGGMATRSLAYAERSQAQFDDYVPTVAGTSPTDQIAQAKALLDSGAITTEEYERLKSAALAST